MEKSSNNKNNFFNIFRKIVLFVSLLTAVVSGVFLLKYLVFDPWISEKNMEEVRKIKESGEGQNVDEKICDFDSLINLNPDIKGWIKIENTVIDYPVLQSSQDDPTFYLDKNYKKQNDQNGSIFINSYNPLFNEETHSKMQNIVMHGHSMKSGKMFSAIIKYSDIEFFKKSPIVRFDSRYEPNQAGKWKIFAVVKTNSKEEDGPLFDYFTPMFDSPEQFLEFIYNIKIRSILDIPVDISSDDKIISLSTCSYEMKDFRTVVFARKIRPGEDNSIDFTRVKKNNNPLMPEIWYKSRKQKTPNFPSFKEALEKGKIDWIKA